MLTNIELGAKVKGAANEDSGKILYLVADPTTDQVTHVVVEKGLGGSLQKVVNTDMVRAVSEDGKTIWLTLSEKELEQQPDYIEREYTGRWFQGGEAATPAPDPITAPTGFLYPVEPITQPVVQPYQEKLNVPENSMLIKAGAEVEARNGRLGKIKQVNFSSTKGTIDSFIVEKGLFFKEEFTVPINLVESCDADRVYLKVNKEELISSAFEKDQPSNNLGSSL